MTVVEQAVAAMEQAKQEILKLRQENEKLMAALQLVKREIQLSGNWEARDFGWPNVRKAIDAAIAEATQ